MSLPQDTVAKIREYAARVAQASGDDMEIDNPDTATSDVQLDQTIAELEQRVAKFQGDVDKLRSRLAGQSSVTAGRSTDSRQLLRQYRTLKRAYEAETVVEPFLPSQGSVLPALLATRLTNVTITSLKSSIPSMQSNLLKKQRDAQLENDYLTDAKAIQDALRSRTARLEQDQLRRTQKSASEVVKDRLKAQQSQHLTYEKDAVRLRDTLDSFVDQYLGAMLAVEELGGPVVGGLLEIDDATLAAGFSQQGKPRPAASARRIDPAMRQQRMDEIWGPAIEDGEEGQGRPIRTEKDAAAVELQDLLEDLFDALVGSNGSSSYITLDRESAAARFLVRAKVAQLHPKDALKIRMVDFARELDD